MNKVEQQIQSYLHQAISELGSDLNQEDIKVDIPKDNKNGDYTSNIAMRIAKGLGKNPREVAQSIADHLIKFTDLINKVEVAGPGFINIFVSETSMSDIINQVIKQDETFGNNDSGNNLKINVEYISVNPTGLLHIGHARGASWGDSITRLMKRSNYDVTREYYVNDGGNQIHNLVLSMIERYKQLHDLPYQLPEDGYHSEDVLEIVKIINEKYGKELLDWPLEKQMDVLEKEGVVLELDRIKEDLKMFHVEMDRYTSEKQIKADNPVDELLEKLNESGLLYESEGALWFKSTHYGDDKDRVLRKSDGSYTYLTPDILYHKDKLDRGYEKLIDIFGADHHGYIPRIKASIQALGYDADTLEVDIIQIVRMMEGDQEVRMSKRTGNAISLRELVDDIGVDAVRYFMVSRAADTHFDFDMELARSASNDNPVYYAQYAHARMCSILKRQQFSESEQYELLTHEKELDLLKWIATFPTVVAEAAKTRLPNKICNYTQKLAQMFHSFYGACKVIDEGQPELTNQRLALVKATQITLRNALDCIGVSAPESM